ncbi:MAG: hypothetical protein Q9217_005980, partial [Psora testacea]
LSRRLKTLATDSQLWKALYYDRFVRPRASRIPGIPSKDQAANSLQYSSRVSRWLDDEHLLGGRQSTNWKGQYKLRHNWSRGSARITETEVAEQSSTPPLLVRLHDEAVIIADAEHGLRAWSLKGEDWYTAAADIQSDSNDQRISPTAMAIDMATSSQSQMNISVGFADGSFSIYTLSTVKKAFRCRYSHASSSNGTISALAYSSPYLLTMAQQSRLSLYSFEQVLDSNSLVDLSAPRLVSSLMSHTAYPPLSLTIRIAESHITASIAYAMPSLVSRWSVGLQELRVALDGAILDSRIASAATRAEEMSSNWVDLSKGKFHGNETSEVSREIFIGTLSASSSRPTSLSYNHPYLLTSHPDNTLTLYMVTSTADSLAIGPGRRLWGHTSSVSVAHIGDRGKAVSVSTKGDELRVWELEGRGSSLGPRRRSHSERVSVLVHPAGDSYGASHGGPSQAWDLSRKWEEVSKGWLAFDEEKVVLLREKMHGAQVVVVPLDLAATFAIWIISSLVDADAITATSLAIVIKAVGMVEATGVEATVVDMAAVVEEEGKRAIHAVATGTCREIALKARNATTAVRLAICLATALRKRPQNAYATSASSQATCRLRALTDLPLPPDLSTLGR